MRHYRRTVKSQVLGTAREVTTREGILRLEGTDRGGQKVYETVMNHGEYSQE